MQIKSNYVPRDILNAWDLTPTELSEFSYLIDIPDNATNEQIESAWCDSGAEFFRYRGQVYDLSEFSRIIPTGSTRFHPMECDSADLQGWDGYASDSYFSGIVVKYPRDEFGIVEGKVIVGTYLS